MAHLVEVSRAGAGIAQVQSSLSYADQNPQDSSDPGAWQLPVCQLPRTNVTPAPRLGTDLSRDEEGSSK